MEPRRAHTMSKFASINKPTAGAREERELPEGEHPIQLYSLATPNGQKVTILLEELGEEKVKYDAYLINIMAGDQFTSGFVAVNPNSKIPAMIDRDGPGGKTVRVLSLEISSSTSQRSTRASCCPLILPSGSRCSTGCTSRLVLVPTLDSSATSTSMPMRRLTTRSTDTRWRRSVCWTSWTSGWRRLVHTLQGPTTPSLTSPGSRGCDASILAIVRGRRSVWMSTRTSVLGLTRLVHALLWKRGCASTARRTMASESTTLHPLPRHDLLFLVRCSSIVTL